MARPGNAESMPMPTAPISQPPESPGVPQRGSSRWAAIRTTIETMIGVTIIPASPKATALITILNIKIGHACC